ncbi:hypothetical protein KCTCHS21_01890 [Cohnella abietis]|uniref:SLH domain-containing protein n=2 Tax=Cohnella abietis TaxID=2507935 RepID=A0A3T1CY81_9BACL|nr:hypothetical protein KCTCHS21_01890 [Cohnella abietis]
MYGEAKSGSRASWKAWLRSGLALVLLLQLSLGTWANQAQAADAAAETTTKETAVVASAPTREQVGQAVTSLQTLLSKSNPIGDWDAFGLARSGKDVSSRYLPEANKSVDSGKLRLVTDYARVALAINANGGDASKVGAGKVNLLSKIANFEKLTAQGINAPAFALLALDAAGYQPGAKDTWSRDNLIKWLVDHRNTDGGWSLGTGKSDVDITGMVLTALAPYKDNKDVTGTIDEAIVWLSNAQRDTGGFGNPTESSESSAQVLIALTSLGINPVDDSRFVKNGKSTLARLLEYRLKDGQFSHVAAGKADAMATFNALLGLTAVERWMDGLPSLYSGVNSATKTNVTVNGISGILATGSVTGKTALEALVNVLNGSNVTYAVERDPKYGPLLISVADLENDKFGVYDGWLYAVKRDGAWVTIGEGMSSFALQAGDELSVYYGSMETALIHSVKLEPAALREGQPAIVKVEKETFDWDSGKLIVSAAEGAQVKVGGQTVTTDKDGKAELKAPKAGSYSLTVDGYRSDAVPTYLSWTSNIQVASYFKKALVRIEGDAGVLASGYAQGGTALEAIEQLLKANGVKYEVVDSKYGKYIESIGGITAKKYGGYDGWLFAVVRDGSWVIPGEGVGTFLLEDGDEVVVYYGDATKLVDPVVITPAQPKPGKAFTVTVTNRAWNWTDNKFDPAQPVVGATVSIGGITVTTNDKGQATLKALPEGLYSLQVIGYEKDKAPSVVRSVTSLPIVGSYKDQSKIAAWAVDAVNISRGAPLLLGINDGKELFQPQQAVTRAEFVAALARGLGLKRTSNVPFKDVSSEAWYAKDVGAAVAAGLVSGVSKDSFAPDATLTREQAAILLTRALKLKATTTTKLVDAEQISASAVAAVQAVIEQGWMTPYVGKFSPKATLSREQAAVIAVRVMSANK